MAGIYLHIPFCKQKCHYCDFHFSTNLSKQDQMVDAICHEAKLRASYLADETINTVYFGGGTPSLLTELQLRRILDQLNSEFQISDEAEVTLECNPDDLSKDNLRMLRQAGVNRLSIGIQSFDDEVLKFMNRAHDSQQAIKCLDDAKNTGFENITIDLIYSIPKKDLNYWKLQLDQMLQFDIPHLSAYSLTIEDNTYFGDRRKKGLFLEAKEEDSLAHFNYMRSYLKDHGFEHYEISNFAKDGFISRHNSAYWKGAAYLGIGPSAHSYNKKSRAWNVANNAEYIRRIENESETYEVEMISPETAFNEYILTRLRTKWGINAKELKQINPLAFEQIESALQDYNDNGMLRFEEGTYYLTDEHLFTVDHISSELFFLKS